MTMPTYTSGILFTQAYAAVRVRIYAILDKYGINPTQWSILGAIADAPEGIRLARVAELIGMTPPMITMIAHELTEKNLIKRVPHHSDKRAKLLLMTLPGKKLASNIERELNSEIKGLLNGLTVPEIAAFQKTLQTIIHNAAPKH